MIMNKTFIFDWSGTLSNNFHCFCQVCDLVFPELWKNTISSEEIKQNFTLPYMKFWNLYFPDLSKERQDEMYRKYIHQVDEAKIYDGVAEMITLLYKKWWKVFVLSSDPYSKLLPETKASGLTSMFTKVIGEIHEKGNVLVSLIQEFSLDKNMTFYVGDTSGDIEAGKIAGVKTIGISRWFQNRDILSNAMPDVLIDDILEIEKIIE